MGEWNGMEIWVVLSVHKTYQRLWNSNQMLQPKWFSYSPPTLFTNYFLFGFFFFLIFYFFSLFFLRNFIPSFCFWFSFFLSLNNNNKNKQLLQTFSFSTNINSQAFKDKKSLSKSCKHNGDGLLKWWNECVWSGWTKES